MATDYRQQSQVRKALYIGLILLLFTLTLVVRRHYVVPMAQDLGVREENLGERELTGSFVRLTLTGSRGMMACILWLSAIDKQKKNEWNELELLVDSITKLQPHFVTPWLFQSWNLAYNVSVESDMVRDKFFYVTRGISLLAEGERRNRDNPDLRQGMGWYYQNKFGLSDESTTFRSLFSMSCIDPKERDPRHRDNHLRQRLNNQMVVNMDAFEKFCRDHPHLVRRLRKYPGPACDTPQKIVEFLEDNRRIPGRFEENIETAPDQRTPYKADRDQRFPVLPESSRYDPSEVTYESDLPDDFNNYDAARAWFKYAQDPVEDPVAPRKPRYLSTVIFQSYPARAQAYRAENLETDGWFDRDGWTIEDWFTEKANPERRRPLVVGDGREWARDAWTLAYDLYQKHGDMHGLLRTPEVLLTLDKKDRDDYEYGRRVTNFEHFYFKSLVEKSDEAVRARKQFYKADQARSVRFKALKEYEHPDAFGPPDTWSHPTGWKRLILKHKEFREDIDQQQETYEVQLKYVKLAEEERGGGLNALLVTLPDVLTPNASLTGRPTPLYLLSSSQLARLKRSFPITFKGPFDDVDEEGKPLLGEEARMRVRSRAEQAPKPAPRKHAPS